MTQKKTVIFRDLKDDLDRLRPDGEDPAEADGQESQLNNAYLVPVDTYYSLAPLFQSTLNSFGGNFPQFFDWAKKLGELPAQKREREIESLCNLRGL
jgi:predicted aminopeptidase